MHMYISSKVTHAKYAVAETRISGVKWITVIHVFRKLMNCVQEYGKYCLQFVNISANGFNVYSFLECNKVYNC